MSVLATTLSLLLLAGGQNTDPLAEGPAVGSRLDPAIRRTTNPDNSAREAAMYRFAQCAVARRKGPLRNLLDARTPDQYDKAANALNDVQRCNLDAYVSNTAYIVSFSSERGTLRGMVAEVFVKQHKGAASLAPLAKQYTYPRDWHEMTGRARPVDEMATCIADTNPAGINALLDTAVGSKEQKAAIGALGPSLGACLGAGFKLNTNPLGLRTSLAEALYHRLYDAPPVAGAIQ
jgi:hypothetical protein